MCDINNYKIYYLKNIDKFKKYNTDNKIKIWNYHKKYYSDNKEKFILYLKNFQSKNANKYNCKFCNYHTYLESNFIRHQMSNKHFKNEKLNIKIKSNFKTNNNTKIHNKNIELHCKNILNDLIDKII